MGQGRTGMDPDKAGMSLERAGSVSGGAYERLVWVMGNGYGLESREAGYELGEAC